jgi:hypothetical protein
LCGKRARPDGRGRRFRTGELKNPIKKAGETCAWKYKGVAFGKL